MNEVVVIKRNDVSKVLPYIPEILSTVRNGGFISDVLTGKKGRPSRKCFYDWLANPNAKPFSDTVRKLLLEARQDAADCLIDDAGEIMRRETYTIDDANIKRIDFAMRLAIAAKIAPRKYGSIREVDPKESSGNFDENSKQVNTQKDIELVPSMTADFARQLLKQKRS